MITTLGTGGAERLMVDLLPLLNDKGNQVELLLFNGFSTPFRNELENRGVIVHELCVNEKRMLMFARLQMTLNFKVALSFQ